MIYRTSRGEHGQSRLERINISLIRFRSAVVSIGSDWSSPSSVLFQALLTEDLSGVSGKSHCLFRRESYGVLNIGSIK